MRTVLGIDRAWTSKNPSGVALLREEGEGWVCQFLAASYLECPGAPKGEKELLLAIEAQGHQSPSVVAVDMPMASVPVIGRRVADQRVSEVFGKYQCGTHSPSIDRPGRIAEQVRSTFEGSGFKLRPDIPKPNDGRNDANGSIC